MNLLCFGSCTITSKVLFHTVLNCNPKLCFLGFQSLHVHLINTRECMDVSSIIKITCLRSRDGIIYMQMTKTAHLHRFVCVAAVNPVHRNFQVCFSPESACPMPQSVQDIIVGIQEQLLQSSMFQTGSVTYEILAEGRIIQWEGV